MELVGPYPFQAFVLQLDSDESNRNDNTLSGATTVISLDLKIIPR